MNEERPVIECRNVTHYYGKKLVYENLNIVVPEGHIMGLLGKNGAGKSTTINILNGFLEPRSGQCLIYGEDTQNLSPETKKRIGTSLKGYPVQFHERTPDREILFGILRKLEKATPIGL